MLKRDKTQEVEQAVRLNRAASSNNQMSSNILESQTAGRTALPGTSSITKALASFCTFPTKPAATKDGDAPWWSAV